MSEELDPTGSGFPQPRSARRHRNRLLAWCIAASVALHALLIAGLPPFTSDVDSPPVQVLDVVLVRAEPPAVPAAAEPAAAKPPKVQRPVPAVPDSRPVPAPKPVDAPAPRPVDAPAPRPVDTPAPKLVDTPVPAAPAVPVPSEPLVQPVARGAAPEAALRSQPQVNAPAPVTPPRFNAEYLRNPPPRYPLLARRRGEEGTVTLRVHVRRDGVPSSVGLEKTSGSSALDNAALDAVRAWRFAPARQGEEAVDAWVLVPIVFRLEGAS